jgi:hypothetical protein
MYILFKEKLWLIIQATKLDLLLTFFVWFEIVINFQDETKNLAKFIHLNFYLFIQNWLKNIWNIGETINTQNISFGNSSLWRNCFWQKDPKKDNSPKCKVKKLAY